MDYERLHITWRGLNEVAPGECVSAYVPRIMSPSERGTERTLLLQHKRLCLNKLAGVETVEIHSAWQIARIESDRVATRIHLFINESSDVSTEHIIYYKLHMRLLRDVE